MVELKFVMGSTEDLNELREQLSYKDGQKVARLVEFNTTLSLISVDGILYSQTKITELPTYQTSTAVVVGDTFNEAVAKISKIIEDNEYVTGAALNALNSDLNNLNTSVDNLNKKISSGNTRPTNPNVGDLFFDTTLGYPIWYNGTTWVDALGNTPGLNYVYTEQ